MADKSKCPFCGAAEGKFGQWKCGTYIETDVDGNYDVGVVCDRDCFRAALIKSDAEVERLKALVKDAYEEGVFHESFQKMDKTTGEWLPCKDMTWEHSNTIKELEGECQ